MTALNLKDKKFGRLTALYMVGKNRSANVWECLCDCGKMTQVTSTLLSSGKTQSCGCLAKELASQRCHARNKLGRIIDLNVYRKRFLEQIEMIPECGCWIWMGTLRDNDREYGSFFMNGKRWRSHQASWILFRGPIPEGMHVLHHCDTPLCGNPYHLFLGNHLNNMEDMKNKKRYRMTFASGELHPNAVLSDDQVREIYNSSDNQNSLAHHHGVSQSTISAIQCGRIWVSTTHASK